MNFKYLIILLIFLLAVGIYIKPPYFLINKLKSNTNTVQSILATHEKRVLHELTPLLDSLKLNLETSQLAILVFKEEQLLITYLKGEKDSVWHKANAFPFTNYSGTLGPKLKQGDRQIPEGIYKVESINPNSSYHLALRVNYPNNFDREKAEIDGREDLGGDIMIHGKNVTIGCIPIGDKNIETLFVMAAKCFNKPIPIIISPYDFRKINSVSFITDLDWETELYDSIKTKLKNYNL